MKDIAGKALVALPIVISIAALVISVEAIQHSDELHVRDEARAAPVITLDCEDELPIPFDRLADQNKERVVYLQLDVPVERDLGYGASGYDHPPMRSTDDLKCQLHSVNGATAIEAVTQLNVVYTDDSGRRELPPYHYSLQGNVGPNDSPTIRFINLGRAPVRIDTVRWVSYHDPATHSRVSDELTASAPSYFLSRGKPVRRLPLHDITIRYH